MELPIIEAGKLLGIHRSTLHRWLNKGWIKKNPETGLINTDQISERLGLGKRTKTKGRAAGWAYREARLSKVGDLGVTLERAVVVLSGILRNLSPEEQDWVKKAILSKINDPKLLEQEEESIPASQMTIVETEQEQKWNNLLVRATVKPKVHTHSPSIQAWGEKLKRRALLQRSGLVVPKELSDALLSIIEPMVLPADTVSLLQPPTAPNGGFREVAASM